MNRDAVVSLLVTLAIGFALTGALVALRWVLWLREGYSVTW